jgi:hypothetical protein
MDVDGGMKADIYDSMAEGVSNAAYQDSANCALELKFAKQSGVPIVPVMMEAPDASGRSWQASGWLGVLTAGSLWTPLYDAASFADNIPHLLRQIELAVNPDHMAAAEGGFSVSDTREELERLRKDEQPAMAMRGEGGGGFAQRSGGMCVLPAQVPGLPDGLRIIPEMRQLLSSLMTSDKGRVGFCGMGGIGKTTISAWIVRQESVRRQFEVIAWVALGQEPNLEKLQSLVMMQLTGSDFDGDPTPEMKQEALKKAMHGKDALLVLDDLWEESHENVLNFIDDTTASKVLMSSRVRGVLRDLEGERTEIVDVGLPTEEEALQLLLSVAGLPLAALAEVAPEVREVVKLSGCLPLTLGIAAKLIKELGVTDDWSGVLELMKQEFNDSGQERSMAERIIRTSLKAIRGASRDNVLRLFRAFAVVPEDTRIPIEMVGMLYEAEGETPLDRPPSLLNVRRWLKVLIDRSLILGTVDRPSLHDIVMDYLVASKPVEAHRGMNQRLVELWRQRRPVGGWKVTSRECVPLYIATAGVQHFRGAPEESVIEWMGDFHEGRQDAIPVFASEALGVGPATELARAAEAAGDWWLAALRWSASALSEHRLGYYKKSLPLLINCSKALDHVDIAEGTESLHVGQLSAGSSGQSSAQIPGQRKAILKHQLEIPVLCKALQSYDYDTMVNGPYTARLVHLTKVDAESTDIFTRMNAEQFTGWLPAMMAQDKEKEGLVMMTMLRLGLAARKEVHTSDHTRRCQLLSFHAFSGAQSSVHQLPEWNWEEMYGVGGSVLIELAAEYNYERMHIACKWPAYDQVRTC